MELSLLEIWETMGILSKIVALGLVFMGLASSYVIVERLLVLQNAMRQSGEFAQKARPLLEDRAIKDLLELTKTNAYKVAPLPRLFRFALETYLAADDKPPGAVELTKREVHRKLEVLAAEARKGMGILASTGSTAPFIGLFGTVVGIITAFQGIAASGGGGIGAVSAGIAEALIVTAVGLVVAIAAVLLYNYLSARFERFDMMMQHASSELLDHLEGADGRSD